MQNPDDVSVDNEITVDVEPSAEEEPSDEEPSDEEPSTDEEKPSETDDDEDVV